MNKVSEFMSKQNVCVLVGCMCVVGVVMVGGGAHVM